MVAGATGPGASTTPHAAIAAPVPSLVTTPAPTAPPAASASQLTGGRTLGQASSGYSVGDLRYGNHPGDFRIVFDISAAATAHGSAPMVITGFGDASTVFIEFVNVDGASPPAPPAGASVTAVKLLSPSPIRDRTIYQITLSHAVKLGAFYLSSPVRLVVDLT